MYRVVLATVCLAILLISSGRAQVLEREKLKVRRVQDPETKAWHAARDFLNRELFCQGTYGVPPDPNIKLGDVLDRAAGLLKSRFSNQPLAEVEVRTTLAAGYLSLGNLAAAEKQLKQVMVLSVAKLGEEHPRTLTCILNLVALYAQDQSDKAEPLYKKVLQVQRRVLGQEHPHTLTTMYDLAFVHDCQGKTGEAAEEYRRVWELQKRVLGPEHYLTFPTQLNLAVVYERQRRYEDAEKLLTTMLEIMRRALGPEHPLKFACMHNLAELYRRQGRDGEADRMFQNTMEIMFRVLDKKEPPASMMHYTLVSMKSYALASMMSLADVLRKQGRYQEAKALQAKLLDETGQLFGPEHQLMLQVTNNMGVLHAAAGSSAEAEKLFRQVLAARQEGLDDVHSLKLASLHNLIHLYFEMGRQEEGIQELRVLVKHAEDAYGYHHEITLRLMAKLAWVYEQHGRREDADQLKHQLAKVRGQKEAEATHELVQGKLKSDFAVFRVVYRYGLVGGDSLARPNNTIQMVVELHPYCLCRPQDAPPD